MNGRHPFHPTFKINHPSPFPPLLSKSPHVHFPHLSPNPPSPFSRIKSGGIGTKVGDRLFHVGNGPGNLDIKNLSNVQVRFYMSIFSKQAQRTRKPAHTKFQTFEKLKSRLAPISEIWVVRGVLTNFSKKVPF